jgi:TolB protein
LAPATLVAALATPLPEATAATPAAATPIAPAPTPAGDAVNRIVIVNDQGQVETLSPTGDDRRVLTSEGNSVFFQFPAWSPDGQRLAVIGSRFTGGGIYVLRDAAVAGSAGEPVYFSNDESPIYLYWSPDSANLAFLANDDRNQMGLRLIDGDGLGESRLLATGAPFYWDWSDDSRQLLVHFGADRDSGLALIDTDGQTQAGNLATPGQFQAPGIAAGGRYWAFAEESEGQSALVVVDTQSGERRAFDRANSLALGWSPNGQLLAYTNATANDHPFWGPLRVVDVAGGVGAAQTRLLSRETVLAFFWSPDGRSIAFITLNQAGGDDGGVNALARTRQLARQARPAQQSGGFLTLSVVDATSGQGLRLLDFEPTVVFLTQFLPFFDQYALSHRLWSPDSSALVLPVSEGDNNVVLVVPAAGGPPFRLAQGDVAFWSPR